MRRTDDKPPSKPDAASRSARFCELPAGGETHIWARKVHADLEARGATVWRDEHSIEEGDGDWVARIREGLEHAKVVVGLVGTDTDASVWQRAAPRR